MAEDQNSVEDMEIDFNPPPIKSDFTIALAEWNVKKKEAISFTEKIAKCESKKSKLLEKIATCEQLENSILKNITYCQKFLNNKIILSKFTKEKKRLHFIRKKKDGFEQKCDRCDLDIQHLKVLLHECESNIELWHSRFSFE